MADSFTMPILSTRYAVTWMPTPEDRATAQQNHGGQTLEELKDRCGVSWCELDAILSNEPYGKNGGERDTDRSRGRVYKILKHRNE